MPDRASSQAKVTITLSLYQPFALGWRSGAALMVGAVLSMLTLTGADLLLLAWSAALLGVTARLLPSPVTTTVAVAVGAPARLVALAQLTSPDRLSEHENVTVTLPLFQPLA